MIRVASFADLGEAEQAGSKLMANHITVDLRGRLAHSGPIDLWVDEAHENRAAELLGLSEPLAEEQRPFRPCPACGTGDPIWLGKWKALLLAGGLALAVASAILGSSALGWAAVVAFAGFAISLFAIAEFECRACHHHFRS